ncbi:MAG: uroporphyrinogen decarboxylase [Bacteroidales bacterium]|nr:uroporphyrinogen decarboxylase [Bacteroidales bacterium]
MSSSIFLKTIKGEKCNRPPVWFMRQAGRVLPSYLKLREQYSFQELMNNPQLAARVTLLPVNELGVDAAILFSDILVVPEALGMNLVFTDKGPVFSNPLKDKLENINSLKAETNRLSHIYETIGLIKNQLSDNKALIGFCGAPFTTFCYMVQGNSASHSFPEAVKLIYSDRKLAAKLLALITELSVEYALNQVKSGIDAFQLFDTHAGLLPYELYIDWVLPFAKTITSSVRQAGCPVIFFPKGLAGGMKHIGYDVADYVGIDWQDSLAGSRKIIDKNVGLQGNIDPRIFSVNNKQVLFAELEKFKDFGKANYNWIFNAGHGVSPDNLFENVKLTVDWVKSTEWNR